MTDPNRQLLKNRATIIGLVLLFTLPILIAWYMVFFTGFNTGKGGYQHGVLVMPARQLPEVSLRDPLSGRQFPLYGKWTMLITVDGDCNEICRDNLYRMRQIRLAAGREMNRLQRAAYFVQEDKIDNWDIMLSDYKGQLILPGSSEVDRLLAQLTVAEVKPDGAIYLIDPAGYYMMIYPYDTDPGGIIKDLKRLLRISGQD